MTRDVRVKTAVGSGAIELDGLRNLRERFERWLGRSGFAEIRMLRRPIRLPPTVLDPSGTAVLGVQFKLP